MKRTFFWLFFFTYILISCKNDDVKDLISDYQIEFKGSRYDENRHFFLGHFFRDHYEEWLQTYPQINSGLLFRRLDVFVVGRGNGSGETRNIVALMDLGEAIQIHSPDINSNGGGVAASNTANDLFEQLSVLDQGNVQEDLLVKFPSFEESVDYEIVGNVRKLERTEFYVNQRLGYITLLNRLQNDELLAVAYEYTQIGRRHQVGEFVENYFDRNDDEVIYLKMLRPNFINTEVHSWDLMMKNIYDLDTSQIDEQKLRLDILYHEDSTGLDRPVLDDGKFIRDIPLIEIMKLDQLNETFDIGPDGNFDFLEGITIHSRTGRIIFPVLEPFGSYLNSWFDSTTESQLIDKYVYSRLYSTTQANAELEESKNKFKILINLSE